MKRFCRDLAFLVAVGMLPGNGALLSADDNRKVTENAGPVKSEKEMKRLIDQLGSNQFTDREQATEKLFKLGKSALPSLKEAAKSPDAEIRRRAQQLVERISAPDLEKELAKLRGTWRVVAMTLDGVEATADRLKQMPLITIKGSSFYWGENEQGPGGTIVSINPTANPKTIEYLNFDGTTHLGIYEFDGDTFKDCLTMDSKKRPKEFTTKPGSGHQLMVHKKVK
jgi:uncharacterized protein (TIGR03067 family)